MEKDFIAVYENVASQKECEFLINKINYYIETNPVFIKDNKIQFESKALGRKDFSVFAHEISVEISHLINSKISDCLQKYLDTFFVANQIRGRSVNLKLQKTPPKGGYHIWHCEAASKETSLRYLAWTLYLNDIPDGEGETEFLWQGIKIKPKEGSFCIFPAAFTHTHRGNPVYSCDKYIATGWVEFDE